jgi:hypothetical protein
VNVCFVMYMLCYRALILSEYFTDFPHFKRRVRNNTTQTNFPRIIDVQKFFHDTQILTLKKGKE